MGDMRTLVVDGMTFSFSSVSSFETCRYAWYLTYVDSVERVPNFFSDFGLHVHKVLERYWKNELALFELKSVYEDEYSDKVVTSPPPFPVGMAGKYYDEGAKFFENFNIHKNEYDVILTEGTINASVDDFKIVVKPDLLLRHKQTGKVILMDYKTSVPKRNGKWDKKKLADYEKQLRLYAHFIEQELKIKVDKIIIIFIRLGGELYEVEKTSADDVMSWFSSIVKQLKDEQTSFPPNTDSPYFCANICSVRNSCSYWSR